MPETKAARHLGAPNEVEQEQLVDRFHGGSLRCCGSCCSQLGLEGVAGHRRPLEHQARILRQEAEFLTERRSDGGWYFDPAERDISCEAHPRVTAERPSKLLEIERIAAALLIQGRSHRIHGVANQLEGLLASQRPKLDPV